MKTYFYFLIFGLILANGSAQNQIQNKPTAASPAGDDWLMLSGDTNGIRKLSPGYYLTTAASAGFQPADSDLNTWAAITPGAGIAAMLAVNVGSAGAPVLFGGAAGTPSSLILTNATGLPLTGLSQSGATTDQVPKWSGSAWVPGTITTGVSSVNGQTGAVTVLPLPTIAALASDALVLSQDNVTRTQTISGTKTYTLASAGSTSDWIRISATVSGTQAIATDFSVYRNGAGSSAAVNEAFTDYAEIYIRNEGGGVIRWFDNKYVARDMPVEYVPDVYAPTTTRLDGHLQGIDAYLNYVQSWIQANGGSSSGTGMVPGTYFGWATDDLENKPAESLLADGTNGTKNAGTFASGDATWLVMGNGTVETPTANPSPGTYDSAQDVSATTGTPGAAVYYTSAAAPSTPSDPTTGSTLYTTPINITDDTNFKFKAFKTLWSASAVASASYVIDIVTSLFSYGYEDNAKPTTPAAQSGTLTLDGTSKLDGVYSVKGVNASSNDAIVLGSNYNELWFYVQHRTASLGGTPFVLRFESSGGTLRFALRVTSAGRIRLVQADGSTTQDLGSTGVFSADTPTGIWVHFKYVTSGTSEVTFHVNKTNPKTKPGSSSGGSSTLTAAGGVERIELTPGSTVDSYWDLATASTSIIGDIP